MDWRHGSYVIGLFDWQGGQLFFKMVKCSSWGRMVHNTREPTNNPSTA